MWQIVRAVMEQFYYGVFNQHREGESRGGEKHRYEEQKRQNRVVRFIKQFK
jgi:hypothetical protein